MKDKVIRTAKMIAKVMGPIVKKVGKALLKATIKVMEALAEYTKIATLAMLERMIKSLRESVKKKLK